MQYGIIVTVKNNQKDPKLKLELSFRNIIHMKHAEI